MKEEIHIKYRDGEPCDHRGCLSHTSHPCEGCGRIAGEGEVKERHVWLDPTIHPVTVDIKISLDDE